MEIPWNLAPEGASERADDQGDERCVERERRADFLAFVAHEVRNPLSTALWSAEMLARMPNEERAGPRGAKLAAMTLRSLGRVRQLVEDHFLVERLDAGRFPLRVEEVPLGALVREVIAREPWAGTAVEVDEPLSVAADRMILERAIDSLLAAASAGGGPVRLRARSEGGRVVVRVEGARPPLEALDDPSKGAASDMRGRSLALPVARRAAAVLGGALGVDGGAFELSLPQGAAYKPSSR